MLAGCELLGRCGSQGCAEDAAITAQVKSRLAEQAALQAPNQVYVQTVDHVVYLTGLVDTPFQRALAESLAREVPGVTRVDSSIGFEGSDR